MAIKEKSSKQTIKEVVDNRKDKISTKILMTFAVGVMLAMLGYAIKQISTCGLNNCYLGGAGAGSLIVAIIWLFIDSLKP